MFGGRHLIGASANSRHGGHRRHCNGCARCRGFYLRDRCRKQALGSFGAAILGGAGKRGALTQLVERNRLRLRRHHGGQLDAWQINHRNVRGNDLRGRLGRSYAFDTLRNASASSDCRFVCSNARLLGCHFFIHGDIHGFSSRRFDNHARRCRTLGLHGRTIGGRLVVHHLGKARRSSGGAHGSLVSSGLLRFSKGLLGRGDGRDFDFGLNGLILLSRFLRRIGYLD